MADCGTSREAVGSARTYNLNGMVCVTAIQLRRLRRD